MVRMAGLGLAFFTLLGAAAVLAQARDRSLPLASVRSGLSFAGADVRALQADVATNPAQLWLAQGRALWDAPAGEARRACRDCHADVASLRDAVLQFPRIHAPSGQLFRLEDQVRHCRGQQQRAPVPAFESDELLALTMWLSLPAAGQPLQTTLDPALQPHWRAGADFFQRRRGQLNLSCAQCHDERWGQRLYTDALSQGHPNGYPLYRLEWQKPGSLERRLRSCLASVRAEVPPWGDTSLRQLSLYLKWRAEGLPVEMPAVRK